MDTIIYPSGVYSPSLEETEGKLACTWLRGNTSSQDTLEDTRSVACGFTEVEHAFCVRLDAHPSQCGGRKILTRMAVDTMA
jgi:hypothetical protein